MSLVAALALYQPEQLPQSPAALHTAASRAIKSGNRAQVEALFEKTSEAGPLFDMANHRGGLRSLKVFATQAPSCQNFGADYWLVVSAQQDIQSHHDTVFRMIQKPNGWTLGAEIPETAPYLYQIKHAKIDASLMPLTSQINVKSTLNLASTGSPKYLVCRLNLAYNLTEVKIDGTTIPVEPVVESSLAQLAGKAIKVGGIVIVPTPTAAKSAEIGASAKLTSTDEDIVTKRYAHVTAWWVPSINRQPFTTQTRILGPSDWVLVSEGEPVPDSTSAFPPITVPAGSQVKEFRCDVPISYPKIVGGKYKLMSQKVVGGKTYSSYQLDPTDQVRADRDLKLIEDSIQWLEKNIGPFPFQRYSVFDAINYYGIESYSYTLLKQSQTSQFVTHEITHTYFGGLVPCSYTIDSSNESLTQYVDSVLYGKNADNTLQNGLERIVVSVPLSSLNVPNAHSSTSYYRGAYVLRMLEHEIGQPAMLAGLRNLVKSRQGKDTTWQDLRGFFEASSGQKLDWFWDQWVNASKFPALQIDDAIAVQRNGKFRTFVTVKVYGGAGTYRLKFVVRLAQGSQKWEHVATLSGNKATIEIDTDQRPATVVLDPFEYTLAHVGIPTRVKN